MSVNIKTYRIKPTIVQAFYFHPASTTEIEKVEKWLGCRFFTDCAQFFFNYGGIEYTVVFGKWIVKENPCSLSILTDKEFNEKYEKA